MSNLSIGLTFSEDGEYLQLSRMDAAILLTWIMGGDHDNEPDVPEATTTPEQPIEPEIDVVEPTSKTALPTRPPLTRAERPATRELKPSPEDQPSEKTPDARREVPPQSRAAAKIIKEEPVIPNGPFSVTSNSDEFVKTFSTLPPTENELLEEDPYWDYGKPPEPKI